MVMSLKISQQKAQINRRFKVVRGIIRSKTLVILRESQSWPLPANAGYR